MKILLSPAKALDEESKLPTARGTQPQFLKTALTVHKALKKTSRKELSDLMKISAKLADLNYERNQVFEGKHDKSNSRPAMYLYNGDTYQGLDAYSLKAEQLDKAQEQIRIISGLYGLLRPLDLIQPYRLEMGTKFSVKNHKDLYELWTKKITDALKKELKAKELLVNLASKEYASAVDFEALKNPVISPVFKDFKNGKLKIISFYAKKARGAMARFIIEEDAETLEDLRGFHWEKYSFSSKDTEDEKQPVFIR